MPPGGGIPEHEHRGSTALVAVQGGKMIMRVGEREEQIRAGKMVLIGVGERGSLENLSPRRRRR